MVILLNYTLLRLQFSLFSCAQSAVLREESEEFATQICQSYEYGARYAPFGNLYTKFTLQAASLAVRGKI
jgi:hypothetical protein